MTDDQLLEKARAERWEEIKCSIVAICENETFTPKMMEACVKVSEEIEKQILEAAEEAVAEIRQELAEQIDDYINNVLIPQLLKKKSFWQRVKFLLKPTN